MEHFDRIVDFRQCGRESVLAFFRVEPFHLLRTFEFKNDDFIGLVGVVAGWVSRRWTVDGEIGLLRYVALPPVGEIICFPMAVEGCVVAWKEHQGVFE